jgi:hypothetical protein
MNQLPPSEAPVTKKKGKGCLVAGIVAAVLALLLIAVLVLVFVNRDKILNWGVTQGTVQLERVLIRRAGPEYDSTRIRAVFAEYRQAGEEGRIILDSLPNIGLYLRRVADTARPLDTVEINRILSNFKASMLSAPDPRWKK